jgi:hypothetical protein
MDPDRARELLEQERHRIQPLFPECAKPSAWGRHVPTDPDLASVCRWASEGIEPSKQSHWRGWIQRGLTLARRGLTLAPRRSRSL